MPLYIPPGRGCSSLVTELNGKGGLNAENSVPGWHDPGCLRIGRFHRQVGRPGTQTKSQPHPLPWRPRSKPTLARARDANQARERRQVYLQRRSPHTRRASHSNDLGPAPKTSLQYRSRSLRPLWRICQSHRLHRGPGHHQPDPVSLAPERTGNINCAIAGATKRSAA